jgi:hypothetical protein
MSRGERISFADHSIDEDDRHRREKNRKDPADGLPGNLLDHDPGTDLPAKDPGNGKGNGEPELKIP